MWGILPLRKGDGRASWQSCPGHLSVYNPRGLVGGLRLSSIKNTPLVDLGQVVDPWDSAGEGCPQDSDRGAVVTGIHWLEFTEPIASASDGESVVLRWVRILGGGVELPRGMLGYSRAWSVMGEGRVLLAPDRPEMGVHVILHGQECDALGENELRRIGYMARAAGSHFTRADCYADSNLFTVQQFKEAAIADQVVSRARRAGGFYPLRGSDAETIVYGGRGSLRTARVYDKGAERARLGLPCTHRTRVEVQHRDEYADRLVDHWLGGGDLRDLIVSAIDVREGEGNVSRRERVSWWAAFIECAERVVMVASGSIEATVARAREWIRKQVAPTLGWLVMVDRGDVSWLLGQVSEGERRVEPWKRQLALGV